MVHHEKSVLCFVIRPKELWRIELGLPSLRRRWLKLLRGFLRRVEALESKKGAPFEPLGATEDEPGYYGLNVIRTMSPAPALVRYCPAKFAVASKFPVTTR